MRKQTFRTQTLDWLEESIDTTLDKLIVVSILTFSRFQSLYKLVTMVASGVADGIAGSDGE